MWVVRKLLYIAFKIASIVKRKEKQYFFMLMSAMKKQGFMGGVSDLIILRKGRCFFVEIKTPTEYKISEKTGKRIIAKAGGTQSDEQKLFQSEVEKEGFPYLLIDSQKKFEEFLNCLSNLKSVDFVKNCVSEVK